MRKKPLREVTEPVVVIPQNKHCSISLFMVPSGDAFRLPDQDGKKQLACGPTLVLRQTKGENHEFTFHDIDDKEIWKWLGGLLVAGWWFLTDSQVASLIPEHLLQHSPRFVGKTLQQREKVSKRVSLKKRTK